jgi:hypothetical protein
MTLVSSGIINNCSHVQELPKFLKGTYRKAAEQRALYAKCCVLSYKPVLKYTLASIKNKLSNDQKINLCKCLFKSLDILHKHGYMHRDLHGGNIMCDETMQKWYIIDYGSIYKKTFVKNYLDKQIGFYDADSDFFSIIYASLENPVFDHMSKHEMELPDFLILIKTIITDIRFKTIKTCFPHILRIKRNDLILVACIILCYDLYIDALCVESLPVSKKNRYVRQPLEKYWLDLLKTKFNL